MTFDQAAAAFEHLVASALPLPVARQRREMVGFIITPWLQTPVPFFSLALALLYHRRGYQVVLFHDDLDFAPSPAVAREHAALERVFARLDPYMPVVRLSGLQGAHAAEAQARIAELAKVNAIWHRRSSVGLEQETGRIAAFASTLTRHFPQILAAYRRYPLDHMVCPGGIYGNSGLYLLAGKICGVRTATYDCGDGRLFVGANDVASYFMDDVDAFLRVTKSFTADEITRLCKLAEEEFARRQGGKDKHSYQVVAAGETFAAGTVDVLFPLSIDWDAPGLGRNRFFESPAAWVAETVGTILTESTATVVVRQHPYNRFLNANDGWRDHVSAHIKPEHRHRFRFIDAEATVNTYDLLPAAKVVLPYVSTLGVEAAFLGKRVIMESNAHYASLPFVQQAQSKEHYFRLVLASLAEPQPQPNEGLRQQALLYYYIVQHAKYAFSDFTPLPNDTAKWVTWGMEGLARHPVVAKVVDALSTATPIAWLNLTGA